MKMIRFAFLSNILLFTGSFLVPLLAQDNEIILTVGVEEWRRDQFRQGIFDDFESQHPGVKVVLVSPPSDSYYGQAAYGLDEHLEGAANYVGLADVLAVSRYNLTVESTRAGFFLDMNPLVSGDSALNADDFFPAAWQSFQWDRGIWALPVSMTPTMLIYNADAFDAAGLPYPNANWTLDDLINAARTLTQKDADGNTEIPGFYTWETGTLFRALLGHGYYDNSVVPAAPLLAQSDLENMLDSWVQWEDEGIINVPDSGRVDFNDIPMTIEGPYRLFNDQFAGDTEPANWSASLLPGGVAGLDVQGFAISAGTAQPELAYELTKYIVANPNIANISYGGSPARRDLVGAPVDSEFFYQPDITPEAQALIDEAIANALPMSELRFSDYVDNALNAMRADGVPAQTALQEAEELATSGLKTAADRRGMSAVIVSTPVPTPVLTAGDVALKFRLSVPISPMPNREAWDEFVAEFTAGDPEVRHIELVSGFGGQEEEVDCFYQEYNTILYLDMQKPGILNLDPFMDADPNFDPTDFIADSLQQVERDNKTWALPVVIEPAVLWYHSQAFTDASVIPPVNGWTVDEFNDALRSLKAVSEDGLAPFVPESGTNTYLLLLMAAYGARPYDQSTDPPTLNLTDPATVETMRQVLNLAKDGYIEYQELGGFGGGFGGGEPTISPDTLNTASWRMNYRAGLPDGTENQYRLALYPRGSRFTPVAFDMGMNYINATTLHPEACYRWISAMSRRPDLLSGMPARRSVLNDPTVVASQGADVTAFYQMYDAMLQDPNVVVVPGQYAATSYDGAWVEQRWINQAFDQYVLKDADLDTVLAHTEDNINIYRACLTSVGELDPSVEHTDEENNAYFKSTAECAINVDPGMSEFYRFDE